jgi:cysteine desulfurase
LVRGWRAKGWRLYSQRATFRNSRVVSRIYLDHAATTALRPEARAAMLRGFELWANASSPHGEGRAARAALEDARARVKAAFGWDGEAIFTGGASEALAIGLGRAKAERRIVSAVEHDAVFRAAPDAAVIGMAEDCLIDRDALADSLASGARPIVALQHVNSETGVVQPVTELASQVRAAGGLLLSDCSQSAGKIRLPDADLIVVSAHKLGGPIGIGALLVRDFAMLEPSGGQERGYRSGTENVPGALGMAAALEAGDLASWETTAEQRYDFRQAIWDSGRGIIVGPQCEYLFSVAHPSISAQALLIRLDAMGYAVSAGSACSSGSLKKSRVLEAFAVDDAMAARAIRVSLGWNTRPDELDAFIEAWRSL